MTITEISQEIIKHFLAVWQAEVDGCECGGTGMEYAGLTDDGLPEHFDRDCPHCQHAREMLKKWCLHEKLIRSPAEDLPWERGDKRFAHKCPCGVLFDLIADTEHKPTCFDLSESRNGVHRIVELLKDAGVWAQTVWQIHIEVYGANGTSNVKHNWLHNADKVEMQADIIANTEHLIPAVYGWVKGT